jgi:hypothetical protein
MGRRPRLLRVVVIFLRLILLPINLLKPPPAPISTAGASMKGATTFGYEVLRP